MKNGYVHRSSFFIIHYSFFSFFIMETFKRNILITGGAGFIGSRWKQKPILQLQTLRMLR